MLSLKPITRGQLCQTHTNTNRHTQIRKQTHKHTNTHAHTHTIHHGSALQFGAWWGGGQVAAGVGNWSMDGLYPCVARKGSQRQRALLWIVPRCSCSQQRTNLWHGVVPCWNPVAQAVRSQQTWNQPLPRKPNAQRFPSRPPWIPSAPRAVLTTSRQSDRFLRANPG